MTKHNANAIRTALNKLERAARDYHRAWLSEPSPTADQAFEAAATKLRQAAIRYTRAVDKGKKR